MKHNWKQLDHTSKDKVTFFRENIAVIEKEWFSGMSLTDRENSSIDMGKHAKYRFNKKNNAREKKRHKGEITINNSWNTQIVQILSEKSDGNFLFKGNILVRLPKFVELTYKWIKKISSISNRILL